VVDNKLIKIKEPNAPSPGDYELALVGHDKVYIVHRLDHKSGRMWRIVGTEWVELTSQP
jgi:hypothetical protein